MPTWTIDPPSSAPDQRLVSKAATVGLRSMSPWIKSLAKFPGDWDVAPTETEVVGADDGVVVIGEIDVAGEMVTVGRGASLVVDAAGMGPGLCAAGRVHPVVVAIRMRRAPVSRGMSGYSPSVCDERRCEICCAFDACRVRMSNQEAAR